ncbi:MAG: hypothetical protein JXA57_18180 [Armatimonadetes bacterium]|nr:hypothetical protein [Armatimonadota bacterium]
MSRKQLSVMAAITMGLVVLLSGAPARAEVPQVISYQGKVTNTAGDPVADGSYTMRFRMYDASTGGNLEWDSGSRTISVSGGVFSVLLGESPQPALNLPFDEDYYLLVTFAGVDQSPRQRLASTGYAYMASGLVPGTKVVGSGVEEMSILGHYVLAVENTDSTPWAKALCGYVGDATHGYGVCGRAEGDSCVGVHGLSWSENSYGVLGCAPNLNGVGVEGAHSSDYPGIGVLGTVGGAELSTGVVGENTWPFGTGCGVRGTSQSWSGTGVFGECTSTAGTNYGVRGSTASSGDEASGVYGEATSSTGYTYGVSGVSYSSLGTGVHGYARYGVLGASFTTEGRGVYGYSNPSTGYVTGVWGECNSSQGRGVLGFATASTGGTTGVCGWVDSPSGIAVRGEAFANTGTPVGVLGRCDSSSGGYGVYGWASATTGSAHGVEGWTASVAGRAIHGWAFATTGDAIGVLGRTDSSGGTGVYGYAPASSGTAYAVYGHQASTGGAAGWFLAENGTTSSTAAGVYGRTKASGSTTPGFGVAGHAYWTGVGVGAWSFNGDIFRGYDGDYPSGSLRYYFQRNGFAYADGGWSSFALAKDGTTKALYAVESPELWFEDVGEGRLTAGRAIVALDLAFLDMVTIDSANPMRVFVQLHDENCEGVAVKKGTSGFEVVELRGGRSGGTFDYRVLAKRKGFESKRMEVCEPPHPDPSLEREPDDSERARFESNLAGLDRDRERWEQMRLRAEEERAQAEQERVRLDEEGRLRKAARERMMPIGSRFAPQGTPGTGATE